MKDFIKWLGVNEKVAKVIVWLAIIMGFLILTNAMLDSLGFPNYQININNLKQVKYNALIELALGWAIVYFNFCATIFLVFRVKEFKKMFGYSILYLVLNVVITLIFNDAITQIFMLIFFVVFSYLYSGKKIKYIGYILVSLAINTVIQGILYTFKMKYINFSELGYATKALLSIDYFIIMAIIVFIKEIYLKKRGENECQ